MKRTHLFASALFFLFLSIGLSACADGASLGDAGTDGGASVCPSDMVEVPGMNACIDGYEYTNAKFAEFLAANGNDCGEAECRRMGEESSHAGVNYPPAIIGQDFVENGGDFDMAAGVGEFPVGWVTWYGARDACLWEGKTMCPWDVFYAACSHGGEWYFPWGGETGGTPTWDGWIDAWEPKCISGGPYDTPVGFAADCEGAYDGLFDLAGNIGEWGGTRELDGYWANMGGSHNSFYIQDGEPSDTQAGASCTFPDHDADSPAGDPFYLTNNPYLPGADTGFRCCYFLED